MAERMYWATPSGAALMYTMARSCKRSSPWPTLAMSMGACFAKPVIAVMPRQLSRTAAQPMSASTVMVSSPAAGARRQPWRSRKRRGISSSAATA